MHEWENCIPDGGAVELRGPIETALAEAGCACDSSSVPPYPTPCHRAQL
jgi:hypothetical protein